jgi:Icc-related predicted phosphoesterase
MKKMVRLAALGDLHCTRTSQGALEPLLAQVAANADILVVCGDITDYGLPEEARVFTKELRPSVGIPVVAVLGNHDYEAGNHQEIQHILSDAGITVLDGDACEVEGIGFAGVKGFGGGFGQRMLEPCGEEIVKRFVHEAVAETLKLESALARLRTPRRVAVLHYAPIQATVEGEPLEIYPFLGSSRLEEPLNRYPVTVVFHGHAHRGQLQGHTSGRVPVYNVSWPLLQRLAPDGLPFRVLNVSMTESATGPTLSERGRPSEANAVLTGKLAGSDERRPAQ